MSNNNHLKQYIYIMYIFQYSLSLKKYDTVVLYWKSKKAKQFFTITDKQTLTHAHPYTDTVNVSQEAKGSYFNSKVWVEGR